MLIEVARKDTLSTPTAISLFTDRTAQFVDRLGWNLCATPEGLEVDEYDDVGSSYILIHDGVRHLGSCRVRPVASGTMIEDHFLNLFPGASAFFHSQQGTLYELTRFLKARDLPVAQSREMLRHLAVALDRFRDDVNATGFVAVVFTPITRFLRRIGVRFITLATAEMDGQPVQMICITHAIEAHHLLPYYEMMLSDEPVEATLSAA